MGALRRATVAEVTDLVAGDPAWWPGFCGSIAEGGQKAIRDEQEMRGWSWGALWSWITQDEGRYRDYQQALEAYVQGLALETVVIADTPQIGEIRKNKGDGTIEVTEEDMLGHRKLQIETRFRLAGKVDRLRWGDRVAVDAGGVVVLDAGLIGFAGALLERLARPVERVIEVDPSATDDANQEDVI